jgi:hypothetical protein
VSLHARIASALGWPRTDAESLSLAALRELVRPSHPALAEEISTLIQGGQHVAGKRIAVPPEPAVVRVQLDMFDLAASGAPASLPTSRGWARFSDDRQFRWELGRYVDGFDRRARAVVVAANPSDADETGNDPTIRNLILFARKWRVGTVVVVNVFGRVASKPAEIRRMVREGQDIIGPENDEAVRRALLVPAGDPPPLVVVAWGGSAVYGPKAPAVVRGRIARTLELLQGHKLHCLGHTDTPPFPPRHPLFLSAATTELEPFNIAA